MRSLRRALLSVGLLVLLTAPAAHAAEAPTHSFLFSLEGMTREPGHVPIPPPAGEFEDACGVATDLAGDLYVSDYYHHTVDVYGPGNEYLTQIADPDPDGPCNLAVDPQGDVYVDNWHRDVIRFAPSEFPPTELTSYEAGRTIDFPGTGTARPTGVFLDPASGDLYVDNRTYVAVYGPASLAEAEPMPLRTFGLGELGEGYGVATSDYPATEGDVYVPDAATDTVRVFGPSGVLLGGITGAGTPQGGFHSLVDSDIAVDQTDGHLFVADNTEPGFESPAAVVDEFNAAGDYRGRLPHAIIDAEPSALAVSAIGEVLVTSGNSEGASLLGFGATVAAHTLEVRRTGAGEGTVSSEPAGIACGEACIAEYDAGEEVGLTAVPAPGSEFSGWTGAGACSLNRTCHFTLGANTAVSAEFEVLPPAPLLLSAPAGLSASVAPATPPASLAAVPRAAPAARHHTRHRRHTKGADRRGKKVGR